MLFAILFGVEMAEEELQIVRLRTEFYRDGFVKVLIAIVMVLAAIASLVALSLYLYLSKPSPEYFSTDNEWRVVAPVPLDQPYLTDAALLQWVGQALPAAFTYDFLSYQSEQQNVTEYFTSKGWQNLLGQLDRFHLDFASLQKARMFANAQLTGAPFIIQQILLGDGKYSWLVQIPMNVSYSNNTLHPLVIVATVVRIPTLDNLYGVGIEDMKITETQGNQVKTNG